MSTTNPVNPFVPGSTVTRSLAQAPAEVLVVVDTPSTDPSLAADHVRLGSFATGDVLYGSERVDTLEARGKRLPALKVIDDLRGTGAVRDDLLDAACSGAVRGLLRQRQELRARSAEAVAKHIDVLTELAEFLRPGSAEMTDGDLEDLAALATDAQVMLDGLRAARARENDQL